MRDRRRIADRRHANSCLSNRSDCRLTSPTRTFHADLDFSHPGFGRLASCFARRLLSSEGSSLTRSAEPARSGRRLCDKITLRIRDRDERVIERSRNVNDTHRDVLSLFLFESLFLCSCCWFCHLFVRCSSIVARRTLPAAFSTNNELRTTSRYFLPGAFFFATAAFLGPLRVRAFVEVRWPRTGKLRR